MILYLILTAFNSSKLGLFSVLPAITTPVWAYEHLPTIFRTIMGFNYYLPIVEVCGLVLSVLAIHFSWKLGKTIIGLGGIIDLNK